MIYWKSKEFYDLNFKGEKDKMIIFPNMKLCVTLFITVTLNFNLQVGKERYLKFENWNLFKAIKFFTKKIRIARRIRRWKKYTEHFVGSGSLDHEFNTVRSLVWSAQIQMQQLANSILLWVMLCIINYFTKDFKMCSRVYREIRIWWTSKVQLSKD